MKRIMAIGCCAAMLGIGINAPVWALGETGSTTGGAFVDNAVFTEKITFSDVPTIIQRPRVKIPPDYGKLVNAYPVRQGQMLWFQNDSGVIRNVIVGEKDLVYMQRQGTVKE